MDNFDLRKYLAKGRLLKEEKISPQEALPIAKKIASKVKDTPEFEKVVDAISKDPKATSELLKLIGLNEGEGITEDIVDKLALQFAKKVEDNPEIIKEEGGFDYAGAFWTGFIGGGTLTKYLASLGDVVSQTAGIAHNPTHFTATVIGAVGGAILALLGKGLYDKIKNKSKNKSLKEDNSSDYEEIVSLLGKLAGLAERNIRNSDNFDLEDMSQVIKGYHDEMKELGGFEKYDDEDDLEDFE